MHKLPLVIVHVNPQTAFLSDSEEVWSCFLMSGVGILHFSNDLWKFIQIYQYYNIALRI